MSISDLARSDRRNARSAGAPSRCGGGFVAQAHSNAMSATVDRRLKAFLPLSRASKLLTLVLPRPFSGGCAATTCMHAFRRTRKLVTAAAILHSARLLQVEVG